MAKPIINFKGVKYKTNGVVGYRPSLEAAKKKSDLELAEEVCIEKRMSMSPDELLHAVQTALLTVPQLVAKDGVVREFTDLLCFNRTASGKLASPGDPWNDTCKANVKVQLKKSTKSAIDASFVNENATPTPRVDNVTWIGASGVTNVVKIGKDFAAYGRYMAFDAAKGDTATLAAGGSAYDLACTSSDVAHAVFGWPEELAPEPGASIVFTMVSRGGVEGGAQTVNARNVLAIEGDPIPVPGGQSSDGKLVVASLKDHGQWRSFEYCDEMTWDLNGTGLWTPGFEGDWSIVRATLKLNDAIAPMELGVGVDFEQLGTHLYFANTLAYAPPAGTYKNAQALLEITSRDGSASETVTLNLNQVVVT